MKQVDRPAPASPISPERLDELVRGLSIEEKAGLTAGIDAWHACGAPSIGLGAMLTLDGPNGVRGMSFPVGSTATCIPCGTALGATWDVALVREAAARIGLEAKRAGVHYMLGPVVNLVRSPLGGRDFEAYSEDPVLSAMLGVAYVEGMQSAGVAATPKHYVANESETHRTSVDCRVDERTLREVYLVPFEAVARAGAWSIMAAYNRVNGTHCSGHVQLVGEILKGEWAWDGVLMSDWEATHDTVSAAVAGLDLEMPGPPRWFGPRLAEAVRRGDVSQAVLDDKARRLLLLAARVGALSPDRLADVAIGAARPAGSAVGGQPDPAKPWQLSDADASALVRRAAAESFVLLANDGTLPLAPAGIRKLAVIGPNAASPCAQGGGAAHIPAPPTVTPLDGLRAALPGVEVVHEAGCRIDRFLPPLTAMDVRDLHGRPGLTIEYWRGQEPGGQPYAGWHVDSSDMHFFADLPQGLVQDDFSVRLSGWVTPAESGPHEIALRGFGGRRLKVDGVTAADLWDAPPAADVPTALFEGREDGATFELQAGKPVLIEAELHSSMMAACLLAIGCRSPQEGDRIEQAVAAAAAADAAIVVVGNDEAWESEGRDRGTVTLPGRQDELVERVAAANPRTVVVVNAGCPMDLPWSDRVAAVLYAWLPGQEFGNALADVLLGRSEPGGGLPRAQHYAGRAGATGLRRGNQPRLPPLRRRGRGAAVLLRARPGLRPHRVRNARSRRGRPARGRLGPAAGSTAQRRHSRRQGSRPGLRRRPGVVRPAPTARAERLHGRSPGAWRNHRRLTRPRGSRPGLLGRRGRRLAHRARPFRDPCRRLFSRHPPARLARAELGTEPGRQLPGGLRRAPAAPYDRPPRTTGGHPPRSTGPEFPITHGESAMRGWQVR
jgi:beta-glucosidase